ncbi:unnamed protein product, partial [Effrenium voratum]
ANGVDYTAHWNVSPHNTMPGSACGSQPQERWHSSRLRSSLNNLKYTVPALCEKLAEFLGTRADTLLKSGAPLTDLPQAALDTELLSGSALGSAGRSTVEEYMSKDAVTKVTRCVDGEEQSFYVMRRSLRYWKDDAWVVRDRCAVEPAVAEAAVSAALATTAAAAHAPLLALGAQPPLYENIMQTSRCTRKYAVAGVGRWCSAKWQQKGALPAVGSAASLHFASVCFSGCRDFMISGACEHSYCALTKHGLIDQSQPWLKAAKGKKKGPVRRKTQKQPADASAAEEDDILQGSAAELDFCRAVSQPKAVGWSALTKSERLQCLRQLHPR